MELAKELDQALFVVGARERPEHEPGVVAPGGVADNGRHRQPFPVEGVGEHRCLAPGRPGGPHGGDEAEPALVLEADPGFSPAGGVFILRQSSATPALYGLIVALGSTPGWTLAAASRSGGGPSRRGRDGKTPRSWPL